MISQKLKWSHIAPIAATVTGIVVGAITPTPVLAGGGNSKLSKSAPRSTTKDKIKHLFNRSDSLYWIAQELAHRTYFINNRIETGATHSPHMNEWVRKISDEIRACGISLNQMSCLDSEFRAETSVFSSPFIVESEDSVYFSNLLKLKAKKDISHLDPNLNPNLNKEEKDQVTFIYTLEFKVIEESAQNKSGKESGKEPDKNHHPKDNYHFKSLSLYLVDGQAYGYDDLKKAIESGKNKLVFSAPAEELTPTQAINGFRYTENSKNAYHLLNSVFALEPSDSIKQQVLQALKETGLQKIQSSNPVYQAAYLDLFTRHFSTPEEQQILKPITQEIFKSTEDPKLSQLAALTLANLSSPQEISPAEKTAIKAALKSESYWTRRLAVIAFNKIKEGVEDQILLIEMLKDSDYEVRNTIDFVTQDWQFTEEHLSTLEGLFQNERDDMRSTALSYITKIKNPKTTAILIRALKDHDYRIREYASNELDRRELTAAELPLLQENLKDRQNHIRNSSLIYITKIKTPEATANLIQALGDVDYYHREIAMNELNHRDLTNAELPLLEELQKSSREDIRTSALSFIAKIKTPEATTALYRQLGERSYYFRETLSKELGQRTPRDSDLEILKQFGKHPIADVRLTAVSEVIRIKTRDATVFLMTFANDSDRSVQSLALGEVGKRLQEGELKDPR